MKDSITWIQSCQNFTHWILSYLPALRSLSITKHFLVDLDKIIINVLSSYVTAHEYGQRKLPLYLGEDEFVNTPEEARIIKESSQNIAKAKELLNQIMSVDKVTLEITTQACRMIIYSQEDVITHFVEEGILPIKQSLALFEDTEKDLERLRHHQETYSMA